MGDAECDDDLTEQGNDLLLISTLLSQADGHVTLRTYATDTQMKSHRSLPSLRDAVHALPDHNNVATLARPHDTPSMGGPLPP